jgi:Protein of unknown function (DUF3606)
MNTIPKLSIWRIILKKKLQNSGRENINDDADEVEYLARALGLSREKVISAFRKIGASEVAVKEALKK